MFVSSAEFNRLFGRHAPRMRDIVRDIYALEHVEQVILFGSYAKGCPKKDSDVDLAVFFNCNDARLLDRYRQLARICVNPEIDIQVQPFHAYELSTPCGIIEEIQTYGIELHIE